MPETTPPDGWVETAMLPRDRYFVVEQDDGWHVYTDDAHGQVSA